MSERVVSFRTQTDRQRHDKRVLMKVVNDVQPGICWIRWQTASSDHPLSSSAVLRITTTAGIVQTVI